MYEDILIATDGSETANVAAKHGVDLAEKYGATVHAVYVVNTDAVSYALGSEEVDRLRAGQLEEMTEVRQKAEEAIGYITDLGEERGVEVIEHVLIGEPSRAIRDFINKREGLLGENVTIEGDIDLIVMGSHGRTGLSRVILGSVSEKILRRTHVPVLVVDIQGEKPEA